MTTTCTLFGTRGSAIAEAVLVLLDADFRSVDAASWEPGPGRDELARVNPWCQVPARVAPVFARHWPPAA